MNDITKSLEITQDENKILQEALSTYIGYLLEERNEVGLDEAKLLYDEVIISASKIRDRLNTREEENENTND